MRAGHIVFISFLLFLFNFDKLFPQNVQWSDSLPGIPIHASMWEGWFSPNLSGTTENARMMSEAGVRSVGFDIFLHSDFQYLVDTVRKYNFKILGQAVTNGTNTIDFIQQYTDAKYTVWEAEGTPSDKGNATLNHASGTEIINGSYIKIKPASAGTVFEMINGPNYLMDGNYVHQKRDNLPDEPVVKYTADYVLKLERNYEYADTSLPDNPLDNICKLQVTQSKYSCDDYGCDHQCTHVTEERTLTRSDFTNLGEFYTHSLKDFKLDDNECQWDDISSGRERTYRDYMEFKVVWLGNQNYLLSVDKVILSDQYGRDLTDTSFSPPNQAQLNIINQTDSLGIWADMPIAAWTGIDEPISLDNYEPIKIVRETLKGAGKPELWMPWMGQGPEWRHPDAPGAMHLSPYEEFRKRAGITTVQQDNYFYDEPYCTGCPLGPSTDSLIKNIDYHTGVLSRSRGMNPKFGVSLQCGQIFNSGAHERNIASHEFLYATNIALMYGAKFLQLYSYFAQSDSRSCATSNLTCHGIIDWKSFPENSTDRGTVFQMMPTDKYFTLRDTINPRLIGLMGTTLKRINPIKQFAGSEGIDAIYPLELTTPYDYVASIQTPGGLNDICFIELGIFEDPIDPVVEYFMPLNRYYSNKSELTFGLRYLTGYTNWQIYDLVDTSNITIQSINGIASFEDIIYPGDANLYSLAPVILRGGSLTFNETITTTQTLTQPMIIENGATLTVNSTYNSLADITVKAGGKIETANGGYINFSNGSKLIIDGEVQLSGTSSNKLNINFTTPEDDNGVVVTQNGELIMTHCNISNAVDGIKSSSLAGRTIIEKVNFVNCSNSAISILGQVSETESTPPPQIKECVINIPTPLGSQTIYGINVTNLGEVEISYNTIRNTKCGIFLSQVGQAYILQNDISSTTPEMFGIFMHSSSGDIRANSITNHTEGIYLINSSPEIGGNIIYHNKIHGIFSGSGSNPYMVAQLSGVPPVWYILSGYNHIYENGGYLIPSYPALDNDGSEIYINASLVQINDGCNLIYDNRVPEADPAPGDLFNSQILMNGTLSGGRELRAENNFWDVHTLYPLSSRFGSLRVDYTPFRTSACEMPQGDEDYLLAKNSKGEVVDTVYVNGEVPENTSTIQNLYSEAEELFREGSYNAAITKYEMIISGEDSVYEKLTAFERLYALGKITEQDAEYFNNLQNIYNNAITSIEDTLLNKILNQKILLSDVSKGEFVSAINGFDNIILQNPASEEAMAAEIDIITTSLLIDTSNTQLGKFSNEKYLVKGSSDYMNKLNSILNKHFGIVEEGTSSKIIPTEYTLYQNYPNPFNPSTTIKFDLPKDGNIELIVYDILGRKITQLVNEYRSAGSYEHRFDASGFSSGIYLYQLKAGEFISSKKMLMIK